MGIQDWNILFDNPNSTYYPGQTVNGTVQFTLDAPKKVRAIKIRFKGEAETHWTESESYRDHEGKSRSRSVSYDANEEYFLISYNLIGATTGEMVLPVGPQNYPFTCALPPTLPSSFEGDHGHIRYTVKVTLDRPWKFDQDTKAAFTVVSVVDLNYNSLVKLPHRQEETKSFCCCCCKSGPLTMSVSLPMTGYVSGQKIPVQVDLDNASDVNIERVNFKLRKFVKFHSRTPHQKTKESKIEICSSSIGPVNEGENKMFTQLIDIPPLPPSNLSNCSIIDLDYQLKIDLDCSGLHNGLTFKVPLTLGTVPIMSGLPTGPYPEMQTQQAPTSSMPLLGNPSSPYPPAGPPVGGGGIGWNPPGGGGYGAPYPTTPQSFMPPNDLPPPYPAHEYSGPPYSMSEKSAPPYPSNPTNASSPPYPMGGGGGAPYPPQASSFNGMNLPPPTFEQSQFGTASIKDTSDHEHTRYSKGSESYAPRYPVYNFPPSAPPPM